MKRAGPDSCEGRLRFMFGAASRLPGEACADDSPVIRWVAHAAVTSPGSPVEQQQTVFKNPVAEHVCPCVFGGWVMIGPAIETI